MRCGGWTGQDELSGLWTAVMVVVDGGVFTGTETGPDRP